ncbi:MAG: hypothetical protein ABI760_23860 [Ferruginibacter sp.]
MKWVWSIVCKLRVRMVLLLILGILLLLILFLLRAWLNPLFYAYLALLILLGLIGLVRFVQGILRKFCWKKDALPKGGGSEGHPPSKPVYVPPRIYKRPDPMIYCQSYLMSKGIAVTWDNPDIQLFDGAVPVPSHDLLPGKKYTIQARIFNGSTDAAAVNMLVRFHYLNFGIGTINNYIGQALVDVPVKGAGGLPAIATYQWTTPVTPGHYCIQVELVWPDDANPGNNLGQENVNVKKLNSPNASFSFMLRNDAVFARKIRLQADSYALPPKEPCPPNSMKLPRYREDHEPDPYARHRLHLYPFPENWQLEYLPGNEFQLAPGEEQEVTLKVTAFDGFTGRQVINVNAFDGEILIGGVTLYAHS